MTYRDVWITDWGEVTVSPSEASLLRAHWAIQQSNYWQIHWRRIVERAELLLADLEKFARWKYDRA